MENPILNLAASQGIWALLSVILILYILKAQEKRDNKQDEREKNYYTLMNKLINKFASIEKDLNNINKKSTK
ncbi:BhlA/UviB family holin-like peptide [Clostridium hydrogenum]|uniref:BhlA/UviB family holin-like peptide n=1 Tax=Clostridium hydrogenum TaxID=2855764 RepID=UPI001EEBB4C6|nr:BhlA/UviB family holin-like peptide [Clostridium hydrogenum]